MAQFADELSDEAERKAAIVPPAAPAPAAETPLDGAQMQERDQKAAAGGAGNEPPRGPLKVPKARAGGGGGGGCCGRPSR